MGFRKPFKPGTRVEIAEGDVLAGERATVEVNPEAGTHLDGNDVWIRYDKDGQTVNKAILTPCWEDIENLRAI